MRRRAGGTAVAGMALIALLLATGAQARKINVHPGKRAIQRALGRAHGGDALRIHRGHYRGGLKIEKKVRLVGAGKKRPVIDGRCAVNNTVRVEKAGVLLDHLKVVGADKGHGQFPSEVFYFGIASGTAKDLFVEDTCDAEYGINIFQSGHLTLKGDDAQGFRDSGYYIGGITNTGGEPLLLSQSTAENNNRGVIVEDSAGGDIRLDQNTLEDNTGQGEFEPTGIFLNNSDGVRIAVNALRHNGIGIHLSPNSDNNTLYRNASEAENPAVFNEGTGNCGSQNAFDTITGNPLIDC